MEKHAGVLPKADGEIKKCCRNVSCSTFALKRSTLNCSVLELFFERFGFDLGTAGMDSRPK